MWLTRARNASHDGRDTLGSHSERGTSLATRGAPSTTSGRPPEPRGRRPPRQLRKQPVRRSSSRSPAVLRIPKGLARSNVAMVDSYGWTKTTVPVSDLATPCQPGGTSGSVHQKILRASSGARLMQPWLFGWPKPSCQYAPWSA